jgi:hypothetical protein
VPLLSQACELGIVLGPARRSRIESERVHLLASSEALPKDASDNVYATSRYQAAVTNLAQVSPQNDDVFGGDDGASQLGTVTGDVSSGYAVFLVVGVDTTTTSTGGGQPGGPGGPPPSGPRPSGAPS